MVGEAGFRIVDYDGEVHLLEVVLVQVLKGTDAIAVGSAALSAEHLVVGGVATGEGAVVVLSRDAADVAAGSGHRARAVAGGESAGVIVSRDAAYVAVARHCYLAVAGDEGAGVVLSRNAAYVAVARHLARHGQALHHAAVADGSEEALVV